MSCRGRRIADAKTLGGKIKQPVFVVEDIGLCETSHELIAAGVPGVGRKFSLVMKCFVGRDRLKRTLFPTIAKLQGRSLVFLAR